MKNKGFTLVELLGVIVILVLLASTTFVAISHVLGTAKERYYLSLENNLKSTARDFASDNRAYLPKSIGGKKKIYLSTLKKANYIKDVVDYSKTDCYDDQTYVQVFKYAANKYSYTTFLVCPTYSTVVDSKSISYPTISKLEISKDSSGEEVLNYSFSDDNKLLSYKIIIYVDNRQAYTKEFSVSNQEEVSSSFSLSKYKNASKLKVELIVVNIEGQAKRKTVSR